MLAHQDILSLVLSKLDVEERARASRVCRLWRAAAVQPPYSTSLALRVLVSGDEVTAASGSAAESGSIASRVGRSRRGRKRKAGGLLPEEAAAVLRGPLCGGLQRLTLRPMMLFPSRNSREANYEALPGIRKQAAASLAAVGAALPPTLLALSLGGLEDVSICEHGSFVRALDLEHTAPRLEDLELGPNVYLNSLGLGHPTLKRVGATLWLDKPGAQVLGLEDKHDNAKLLGRLPRLEALGKVESSFGGAPGPCVEAGVRTEWLHVSGERMTPEHCRLLRPGATLILSSATFPEGEDWSLPAGLAQIRLILFSTPRAQFEFLLLRIGTYAPGLKKLVFSLNTLGMSSGKITPGEVIAALERYAGGTQIEILWPGVYEEDDWCSGGDVWSGPKTVAPLARALATSATLQRYVHVALPPDFVAALKPAARKDYREYLRARKEALRGMGEEGRRLLCEQGYDNEDGPLPPHKSF